MTTTATHALEASEFPGQQAMKPLLIQYYDHVTAVDRNRLQVLDSMIEMASDRDWELPNESYCDIRETALACYVSLRCQRLLPASIADLARELRHEIHAYAEFCKFRTNSRRDSPRVRVTRLDWLQSKRQELRYLQKKRLTRIRLAYRRAFFPTNVTALRDIDRSRRFSNGFATTELSKPSM